MNPKREKPIIRAHREIAAVLRPGEIAVDATAGNGHDTLFLAKIVAERGRVVAFDVQPEAIASTQQRIETAGFQNVSLHLASHSTLAEHLQPDSVGAVVFNLGYLPGGDHSLITTAATTLSALRSATGVLRSGGLLTVVCYPGHPGGDGESAAVVAWADELTADFAVEIDRPDAAPPTAPFLILVHRR
jgi:ubiquinone/menaquinone biosynthesis C-methylase UbiE